MMIKQDYAQAIAIAKSRNATLAKFDNTPIETQSINAGTDRLTLSDRALALLGNKNYQTNVPTSVRPKTARSLIATYESIASNNEVGQSQSKFSDIFQHVLDQRLGVDRKKLDEIDAMMEEVANNEKMSTEEKAKALEELMKIKEKIIEESIEIQKVAKQTIKREDENHKSTL